MSGRSSYEHGDSVQIQRAKAQREREQQIQKFKEEAEKGPINQTGLPNLFSAPKKLQDGDPTARRILGEPEAFFKSFDSVIGITGDQPQTPIQRKSRLGFPFPKSSNTTNTSGPINGIVDHTKPTSTEPRSSSSAANGPRSSSSASNVPRSSSSAANVPRSSSSAANPEFVPKSESSADLHDSTTSKRDKDRRRSSKEKTSSSSQPNHHGDHGRDNRSPSNTTKHQNHPHGDHGHNNRSPSKGTKHQNHHQSSKSHSPHSGSSHKTSKSRSSHTENDVITKPHKDQSSPTKEPFHPPPPNGSILQDGTLSQFKLKIPKLQIPQKNKTVSTTMPSAETSQDVYDILTEMTCIRDLQPLNPIQTPNKDPKKFPFTHNPQVHTHARNVFESQILTGIPNKTESKDTEVISNGKIEVDSDSEPEHVPEKLDNKPLNPQSRSVTSTTTAGGSNRNLGGRSTAPSKENSNLKSMSSDESSASGSDTSSEESGSEDNTSDDEEEKKKERIIPKPKTPPPLISPPSSNEKKSWALGNFLPTSQEGASPNFPTNANLSDKSLNGSFKEDPNNDLLDEILVNIGNNNDVDEELDLDAEAYVHKRNNKNILNNDKFYSNISDIVSSLGGSSDEEFISSPKHIKNSLNHSSHSPSAFHHEDDGSDGEKRTSKVSSTPSKTSSNKNRTKNTPKKTDKEISKKLTPLSQKKPKKSPRVKIESDSEEEIVDVEYLTPEKKEVKNDSSVLKHGKSAVTKLDFSDSESPENLTSVFNKTSEKNSKVKERRKSAKSESKNSGKKVKDALKTDKSAKKTSNSKSKERHKDKRLKDNEDKENMKNEPANIGNLSMDKDIHDMININRLLSPIPHIPDKIVTSSDKSSVPHPDGLENNSLEKSLNCEKIPQDNKYEGLTFVDGKPSIIVQLDLSLLNLTNEKDVFKETPSLEVKPLGDSESLMPSLDEHEPDISSPKSKLDSSFSSQTSQLSATSCHVDHKKSSKRKADSDRSDTSKRRKSSTKAPSKKSSNSDSVIKTEEESHEDDHTWDRKWDQRPEVKERHDSTSSNSSQTNGQLPKKSENQIEDTELDKHSEFEIKDDQLPSVTTSSEGHISSVETFYDREGDMEVHIEPSRPSIKPIEERLESADFHLAKAKELKHQADSLTDRLAKSMVYTEAILSFIQCGCAMEREQLSDINKIFTMYRDTFRLVTHICRFRGNHDNDLSHKEKILAVLSLRIQSLICLRLFKLKKPETMKYKRIIEDHNKTSSSKPPAPPSHAPSPHQNSWNNRSNGTPSPMSPVPPSPAGSIGSVGSQGSCNETPSKLPNGSISSSTSAASTSMSSPSTVSIPQRIHSITQQYFTTSSFLLQCHDYWDQADAAVNDYKEFFEDLDDHCGPLSLHSSIPELVIYVQTGLQHLKNT